MSDIDRSDKNHILAKRAENLLFYLKQRYPELSQTTLDTCKIQYNKASFYLIQMHLGIYAMIILEQETTKIHLAAGCRTSSSRELLKSIGRFGIQHRCSD